MCVGEYMGWKRETSVKVSYKHVDILHTFHIGKIENQVYI